MRHKFAHFRDVRAENLFDGDDPAGAGPRRDGGQRRHGGNERGVSEDRQSRLY